MKKMTKKFIAIAGSSVIAIGLMALPALAAGTTPAGLGNNWFTQMQNFMNQNFTPAEHQQIMNSSAMQSLHHSPAMQQAMQSGNISSMQEIMNSDSALKNQIGAQNLAKMNQLMNNYKNTAPTQNAMGTANYNSMMGSSNYSSIMGSSHGMSR